MSPCGTRSQIPRGADGRAGESTCGSGAGRLGAERGEGDGMRLVWLAGTDPEGPGPAWGI